MRPRRVLARAGLLSAILATACDRGCAPAKWYDDGVDAGVGPRPVALLVDGARRDVCVADEFHLGRNRVTLGELTTNSKCRDEIAVFRAERGLSLIVDRPWGAERGETVYAESSPPTTVDVVAWISDADGQKLRNRSRDQHGRAHQLLNTMMCGLRLRLSVERMQARFVANGADPCNEPSRLRRLGHRRNAINVYYIAGGDFGSAASCREARNLIWMTYAGDYESLAHEIGHAFGLSPGNLHVGVKENLMASPSSVRKEVALGQCFRMNLSTRSFLHTLAPRFRERVRPCDNETASVDCPARLWPDQEPQPQPPASTEEVVREWLDCEECAGGELERLEAAATSPRSAGQIADVIVRLTRSHEDVEAHLRRTFTLLGDYASRQPDVRVGAADFTQYRRFGGTVYRRGLRGFVALDRLRSDSFDPTSQEAALINEVKANLDPAQLKTLQEVLVILRVRWIASAPLAAE